MSTTALLQRRFLDPNITPDNKLAWSKWQMDLSLQFDDICRVINSATVPLSSTITVVTGDVSAHAAITTAHGSSGAVVGATTLNTALAEVRADTNRKVWFFA